MRRLLTAAAFAAALLWSQAWAIFPPGVRPTPPASWESFRATATWQKTEKIAWRVATEEGLDGWSRRVFMIIVWNESRGQAKAVGDEGCSLGLTQLQVGGSSVRGVQCADNRKIMGDKLNSLPRDRFLEPEVNLRASIAMLRRLGFESDPLRALSQYAGCEVHTGNCAKRIYGRYLWWWSGMKERIEKLEEKG